MNGPTTRPLAEVDAAPSYPKAYSKSVGGDDEESNSGNINKIVIDLGKSVSSIALCAAFCGICVAITIGTVWHSKEREVSTEAQYRKTQNHVDEMTNELKRLRDRLEDKDRAN